MSEDAREGFAVCSNPACDTSGQPVPAAIVLDVHHRKADGNPWEENTVEEIRFLDDADYTCPECEGGRVPLKEQPPEYAKARF